MSPSTADAWPPYRSVGLSARTLRTVASALAMAIPPRIRADSVITVVFIVFIVLSLYFGFDLPNAQSDIKGGGNPQLLKAGFQRHPLLVANHFQHWPRCTSTARHCLTKVCQSRNRTSVTFH